MKERIRVVGKNALLTVVSGRGPDKALVLHGSMQCFELAEILLETGEYLAKVEFEEKVPTGPNCWKRNPKKAAGG